MRRRDFLTAAALAALTGCAAGERPRRAAGPPVLSSGPPSGSALPSAPAAAGSVDAAAVLARSTVPVLCFHQLREHRGSDSSTARYIITPPKTFRAQLRGLKEAGYTAITGTAYVDHLEKGTPLPEKPIVLSFDDGSRTHHSVGLRVLDELGWPGVFFPMTIVLDKPDWLTHAHLRDLAKAGHEIGAHTYDHQAMPKVRGKGFRKELDEPKAQLEQILGKPVDLMAYPFGAWEQRTLPEVERASYRAAFQLVDQPQDKAKPQMTIRRLMPPPFWSPVELVKQIEKTF